MENTQNKQQFRIDTLGITYSLEENNEGAFVTLTEDDFEKIFTKIRELQIRVEELQDQVIEGLKRQALIKNILNS